MSFSSEVKNEVARLPQEGECCLRAELSAVLRMGGSLVLRGRNFGLSFMTENAALARRLLSMAKHRFDVQTEVVVKRSVRLKKNNLYQLRLLPSAETARLLAELELLPGGGQENDKDLLRSHCCRRAFLRGAFLAGGSVSRPSSDYHLEMVTENEDFAQLIQKTMRSLSLTARLTDRKKDFIVYMKEGDAIIRFLSLIGAHQALLEFENVRVVKEMRNQVNRVVNCETANLEKTVQAAVRQLESIRLIQKTIGLAKLPRTLREAAELRLNYPEAALRELVELSDGHIGKSGMNHRFRKLEELADSLRGEVLDE